MTSPSHSNGSASEEFAATTPDEVKLIRRLERLARDWPSGYMIASLGGTLCLFRSDDRLKDDIGSFGGDCFDETKMLWSTIRIPNSGGDW